MEQLSIKQIEESLLHQEVLTGEQIKSLRLDQRKGVKDLLIRWERRREKQQLLRQKYEDMSFYENECYGQGCQYIAGIDEVGRGPLAGPVVAAAVILKRGSGLHGINDSKQLSESKRELFYAKINEEAVAVGIGMASAAEIDELNIYQASKTAMLRAVADLKEQPEHLLIDAMTLQLDIPQTSLIKGDSKSISIAAGSIVAKVTRDRIMTKLDRTYPGYGFSSHMGYCTKMHTEAIERLGPCPEHRRSFSPVSRYF